MHRIKNVVDKLGGRKEKFIVKRCNILKISHQNYITTAYKSWIADPSSPHPICNRNSSQIGSSKRSYSAEKDIIEHIAVHNIIASFQTRGHHVAKLDPLERDPFIERFPYAMPKETPLNHYGEELLNSIKEMRKSMDLQKVYKLPPTTYIGGSETSLKLKDILDRLERIYCGTIGYEFTHINSKTQVEWIKKRIETASLRVISPEQKKTIFKRLVRSAGFENFLARKFPSLKRFGLEGCDMFIPGMNQIIDTCTKFGGSVVNIGIAHRGRINCLANVAHIPLRNIYMQFMKLDTDNLGIGDMKYHLGGHTEGVNEVTSKNVLISVTSNPSHLECVAPVTMGRTRAQQFYSNDPTGIQSMAIIVHGNQAMCGQGVVFESICLSDLPHYTSNGSVHVTINNQLGFTTTQRDGRSSPYCTDVGMAMNSPVFHVNSDDPEAVIQVCQLATEYRYAFRKDPYIEIYGYRKYGHSETDEPMFTQPLMYTKIKFMTPILDKYALKLNTEGVMSATDTKAAIEEYDKQCEAEFAIASKEKINRMGDWLEVTWPDFAKGKDMKKCEPTGAKESILMEIGKKFSSPPPVENFEVFKGLTRVLKTRTQMMEKKNVDFAIAEAMAFGTLLMEGTHVRITGQDAERATFSHRHHVIHHQTTLHLTYNVLDNLSPNQARYTVYNSPLSEYAVMGFELGYSTVHPNSLCIWEAQFGDFCNTGQCMIDQFISAGEAKWLRQSGLVMQLPHGLEGNGAEHSSCRPERFLQMSTDDPDEIPAVGPTFAMEQLRAINWILADCTTPANLFHILRRQVKMPFRKPLVLFYPKSLLRLPAARSPISEMVENTEFKRIIPDPADPAGVKKVVFCSGKVYYDLKSARDSKKLTNEIAIVRIEQLSPFPYDLIKLECARYPKAKLGFVQEEHKNQGFWTFVEPRFRSILGEREVKLIATRPTSASPATGLGVVHARELKNLLDDFINK